jgi:RIO kinase 2
MKLDVRLLRHLSKEDFRVLGAVEQGMKNHSLVPTVLIVRIAGLKKSQATRSLSSIARLKLVWHGGKPYDGYRLTYAGYDFLALKAFSARGSVTAVGPQIGVGKESDIYSVSGDADMDGTVLGKLGDGGGDRELATRSVPDFPDEEDTPLVLKLQRLGRVSFRSVKQNRDYLRHRQSASWLYMSRLGAIKEFSFMKALYAHGFPVPKPVDWNRHAVVMTRVDGTLLNRITKMNNPEAVYQDMMDIIVRFGRHGLIHCDYNEYNIMLSEDERVTVIDFPQMVSTSHLNAQFYFDRDVECVRAFFRKRFGFESDDWPRFDRDVLQAGRVADVDIAAEASGYGFTEEDEERFIELTRELEEEEKEQAEEDVDGEVAPTSTSDDAAGGAVGADETDSADSNPGSASEDDSDDAVPHNGETAEQDSGDEANGADGSRDGDEKHSGPAKLHVVRKNDKNVKDTDVRTRVKRSFAKKSRPKLRKNVQKNKTRRDNQEKIRDHG